MTPLHEIEGFSDLPLNVDVQLDNKSISLQQLLELGVNSVIKLPRSAGENIDVFIGGTLVCHGEIVIIDDSVGVRITDFREEA